MIKIPNILVLLVMLFIACSSDDEYTNDPKIIEKGATLFETHCPSCHNFKTNGIGPNLSNVTKEVSKEYLINFINNPAKLIEEKEERALKVFKQFKTIMPSYAYLGEENIAAILAYMNTQQGAIEKQKNINRAALPDPIKDTVAHSKMALVIRHLATAPVTSEKSPLARINKMIPLANGSDRLFIQDLNGFIYELIDGKFHDFLKIRDHFEHFIHRPGLASGFGSFAFHPDYENNGLFYTNHTENPKLAAPADFSFADSLPNKVRWVLTEWKQDDPKAKSFKGTKRELLRVDMVTQIHGMQEIMFNPYIDKNDSDYGHLYIGIGDGGAVENGYAELVQNRNTLWGSILRIDPRGNNSENGNYGIPKDNPFVSDPDSKTVKEVWARGFRNPHRLFWHPLQTNRLFASDIGHLMIEELNEIEAKRNYGWPAREGAFLLDYRYSMDSVYVLTAAEKKANFTNPIIQFDHDVAGAISSGFIYNGKRIPSLKGKYLLGGIVNGRVFYADAATFAIGKQSEMKELSIQLENGELTTFKRLAANRVDLRFGYDGKGELYVFTKANGKVYEVIGMKPLAAF